MQTSINSEIARILIEERAAVAGRERRLRVPELRRRPARRYRMVGLRAVARVS